jgi:hypothetical protein
MKRGTAVALGLGINILFTSACASPQAVRLAPLAPEASTEARAAWRRARQGQVVEAPVPGIRTLRVRMFRAFIAEGDESPA